MAVQSTPGCVELRIGPLAAGGARRVLDDAAVPEYGPVVERLATTVKVRPGSGGGDYLVVRVQSAPEHVAEVPAD